MHPCHGYRFEKGMQLPIRALSPNHGRELSTEDGGELPHAYMDLVIERARRYGFNQLHIANNPVQNDLDQFVHYTGMPGLEEAIGSDRSFVEKRIALFQDWTAKACAAGIETYVWHHELNFPEALSTIHPDGFENRTHAFPGDEPRPVPRLESSVLWDFMEARFEEAYANLPDLTGIILTVQESDIPIYHLREDQDERIRWTRTLYERINEIHKRLDRKWILRTFAWREWEYDAVFKALNGFDPEVVIEMKAVPMDWHMWYPYNALIQRLRGRKTVIEMEVGGNFWGECEVPAINPRRYGDQLRFAAQNDCIGAVLRVDRQLGHTFDKPMEAHVAMLGAQMNDMSVEPEDAAAAWIETTYGSDIAPLIREMLPLGWNVVSRMHYVEGSFFLHHLYFSKIRGTCNVFVGERDLAFEPGETRFRDEIVVAEHHLRRMEELLAQVIKTTRIEIPATMPATLHDHIAPAPHPVVELARQVRNLRERHDYFSAAKEFFYALRCYIYNPTAAARKEASARLDAMAQCCDGRPHLHAGNPAIIADLRTVLDTTATREILESAYFSAGHSFHGKSYAVPYPEALGAELPVRPGANNILVVFCGTHHCRETVLDITVNDETFELRRGTMSWFWSYDGYRRGEIELPAALCENGIVEVSLRARDAAQAPWIPEIRTEVESDGYCPRKD